MNKHPKQKNTSVEKEKCKHKNIVKQMEYISMDCYAYVVRCKKCNKLLATGWSVEEVEANFKKRKKI